MHIEDLVHDLAEPDYPPMPDGSEPIDPLPLKRTKASRIGG